MSRFLPNPSLSDLDIPKTSIHYSGSSEPTIIEETPLQPQPETQPSSQLEPQSHPHLQSQLQQSLPTALVNDADPDHPICGPEMINTLEQLKISLQNITHVTVTSTNVSTAPQRSISLITPPSVASFLENTGNSTGPAQSLPSVASQSIENDADSQTENSVSNKALDCAMDSVESVMSR